MKVMLEELNDHKIHKSPKLQEVFNSEKCFCNKFLNLGKQYLTSYLRDAGRHHYDVGLKSNLSHTRTFLWMDITFQWPPSFRYGPAVRTPYILQDIFHFHWSRMNLFTARFVKASLGRTSTKVKCWELRIGTCFEPSFIRAGLSSSVFLPSVLLVLDCLSS